MPEPHLDDDVPQVSLHDVGVSFIERSILAAAPEGLPLDELPEVLEQRGGPVAMHRFRQAITRLLYRGDVSLTADRRVVPPTAPCEES